MEKNKKDIKDICIVVQARLNSERVPGKMTRPFSNTTLVDILLNKLNKSSIIPKSNIYFSVYENELKEIGRKNNINIFERSEVSANSEGKILKEIFEWYNQLPYKYVIMISACNPLLTINTIDNFINNFINTNKEGGFAVFEKKTYYWDSNNIPLTDWKGLSSMNTKYVDPIYEAAHCLYASRLDIIEDNHWMTKTGPEEIELFIMNEIEAFDIDYEWQFKVAETLYERL